jgi:hypothetical protein
MNQIINMIIRQVMRQLVNRGINAGFDKASRMGKRRAAPRGEIDDYGNPVEPQMTREERRAKRQARQNAGAVNQSAKALGRISKL